MTYEEFIENYLGCIGKGRKPLTEKLINLRSRRSTRKNEIRRNAFLGACPEAPTEKPKHKKPALGDQFFTPSSDYKRVTKHTPYSGCFEGRLSREQFEAAFLGVLANYPAYDMVTRTEVEDAYTLYLNYSDGIYVNKFAQPNLYGECWDGMATHASEMSGLDRQMFEDCNQAQGSLQRPGLNVPTIGKRNMPERLAKRLDCSLERAEDIICYWRILDEKGGSWPVFERWLRVGERLVLAAAKTETVWPFCEYWFQKGLFTDFQFHDMAATLVLAVDDRSLGETGAGYDTDPEDAIDFDIDYGDNWRADLETRWRKLTGTVDDVTTENTDPGLEPEWVTGERIFDRISWRAIDPGVCISTDSKGVKTIEYQRTGDTHYEQPFSTPAEYAYTIIEKRINRTLTPSQMIEANVNMWHRQPHPARFAKLIRLMRKADLDSLSRLPKKVFKEGKLSWMSILQSRRFWKVYREQRTKLELESIHFALDIQHKLLKAEEQLFNDIQAVKSLKQVKYFWFRIYNAKAGKEYFRDKKGREHGIRPKVASTLLALTLKEAQMQFE